MCIVKRKRHILIVTPDSYEEMQNPTYGSSKLTKELVKELERKGYKVSILSLHGIVSISSKFLITIKGSFFQNKRNKKLLKNGKLKWFLMLIRSIIGEIISRIDLILLSKFEKEIKKIRPDVIFLGPYIFLKMAKKLNIPCVVCVYNIGYYFFIEMLGNTKVSRTLVFPLVFLYKLIEISAYKKADEVICFSENDKSRLVKDGIPFSKILVWKFQIHPKKYDREKAFNNIPFAVKKIIGKKPVVCFLGADYTPNIIAVQRILQIACCLPDVIFLIVGSVGERFKGMKGLPQNVLFTGYVKDVEPYLIISDVFLNLKLMSDTGIEAKMFDYLRYN